MENGQTLLYALVDIFNTGEVAAVDAIFAAEYVDHQKPADWDIDGPEEFKRIVTNAHSALASLEVTVEDVFSTRDRVAARLHWHSIDLAGREVHRETLEILRIAAGKVVEHWGAEAWRSAE